ncbi:MAG: Gfo/Idh/MocA family oxidoreductase [Phycisphaerales bacterium]|nr:Gfo/Idh/MocA family oxidoreductase [Phycisphaerales bacterium]
MRRWKVVGINFDHMHMGDLLRQAKAHRQVDLVGVSDEQPERVWPIMERLGLDRSLFFGDYRQLLEKTKPDLAILCPATADHADWVEKVAPFGPHLFVEKPFAATLEQADRMIAAAHKSGRQMAINWPLRWVQSHVTAKRLCDEGLIGQVIQVHYYDGNRGPLRHEMDKIEISSEQAIQRKSASWFYQKQKEGGSMLDYLGYGTTLGTWYLDGRAPIEVTATIDQPAELEVDEQSVTVARYDTGLSKFETHWGTFTDPWSFQPQPKCGFVLVGRKGTISTYDYESTVRVQTENKPEGYTVAVDELKFPFDGPINYVLHCLETAQPFEGPLSPRIARIGQQIVDTAARSAREKRTVKLLG